MSTNQPAVVHKDPEHDVAFRIRILIEAGRTEASMARCAEMAAATGMDLDRIGREMGLCRKERIYGR